MIEAGDRKPDKADAIRKSWGNSEVPRSGSISTDNETKSVDIAVVQN